MIVVSVRHLPAEMVLTVIDALPSSSLHKGTWGTAMPLFATCNCTIRENLICALTSPHESLKTDSNLGENNPSVVERSLFFPNAWVLSECQLTCFVLLASRSAVGASLVHPDLMGHWRMEDGGWASTKRKGPDHAPVCFVYSKIALPAFFLPGLLLCLLSSVMCDPWRRGDVSGTLSRNMKSRSDWRLLLCIPLSVCLLFPFLSSKIWLYFAKDCLFFQTAALWTPPTVCAVVTSTFAADVSGVTAKPLKHKEDSVPLSGINTPLIRTDNLWLPALLFDGISHLKETQGPYCQAQTDEDEWWRRICLCWRQIKKMTVKVNNFVLRWLRPSGAQFKSSTKRNSTLCRCNDKTHSMHTRLPSRFFQKENCRRIFFTELPGYVLFISGSIRHFLAES